MIESKYDQSDKNKQTLKKSINLDSVNKKKHIDNYAKAIVKYIDFAISEQSPAKQAKALSCVNNNLKNWASANALLNEDTSKTGHAVRKWFLSSLALGLLTLDAVYSNYSTDKSVQRWLRELSQQIRVHYNKRLVKKTKYFNNHDYWAALAVASTGVLYGDISDINWGNEVFSYAMSQLVFMPGSEVAYFPNEVHRGRLAANYTHFAITPLMLLADILESNNIDITKHKQNLQALAKFGAASALSYDKVRTVYTSKQEKVTPGKMIWVLPYRKIFNDKQLTHSLLTTNLATDRYSQAGGNLSLFYP